MKVHTITNQNNYKIPQFMGLFSNPNQIKTAADSPAVESIKEAALSTSDTFAKSAEPLFFAAIADIKNYLEQNKNNLQNGKIFNIPITKDGDSLLMALLHIKPIMEEKKDYENILKSMSSMSEINYDQKDSMDISALEWVVTTENSEILSFMKGQKLTQDPMMFNAYQNIKNPEFKKAFLESGLYTLPAYKTKEEQEITIRSIINKKFPSLSEPYMNKDVLNNLVESYLKVLSNNQGEISGDTMDIFKKIVEKFTDYDHLEVSNEGMVLLKNENGDIDIEKAAEFLAKYEKLYFTPHYYSAEQYKNSIKTTLDEAFISVIKNYDIHEAKGIFDLLGFECKVKDGGIVLNSNYISVPAYQGSMENIDMDMKVRHYDIDENKLLKNVTHVFGHMSLQNNKRVTSLPNLIYASHLDLNDSSVKDLPKLKGAYDLYLKNSQITCLPELEEVTSLWIGDARIMNLPEATNIRSTQNKYSKIINLPKIKNISYLET